jgi:hypothetical protein
MNSNEYQLLELYNHRENEQTIWLEPWGESIALAQNVTYRLVCFDGKPGMVGIEFHADGTIAIHGVADTSMRVYQDGTVIWESFQPFSPPGSES